MKIPINLATHPYENVRPLFAGLAIAGGLAIVLAAALALNVRSSRSETRMLTEQSAKFDREAEALAVEQNDLTKWLARPEVQDIRNQSDYLNSLIVRKSLSWTQLFVDLEKVLPNRVMVTSIRPGLTAKKEAELGLSVSALTLPPLVNFLKNLESSTRFDKPVVASQRYPAERDQNPAFGLELLVGYRPGGAEQADMVSGDEEQTVAPAAKQPAPQPHAFPVADVSLAPPKAAAAASVPSQPAQAPPESSGIAGMPPGRRAPVRERQEGAPAASGREAR